MTKTSATMDLCTEDENVYYLDKDDLYFNSEKLK